MILLVFKVATLAGLFVPGILLRGSFMELVIEVGLLCGASFGITYERLQKHTLFIDFFFLRLIIGYGPEESCAQ
jgi:hypothetical protein